MASEYLPRTIEIPVTSGSGSVTKAINGVCVGIAIKTPGSSQTDVYDFEVLDDESFGLIGEKAVQGPCTINRIFQMHENTTFSLDNCSADGTYAVRIWFKE